MKTQALLMDAATSDAILIPMLADEDADSDIRGVEDATDSGSSQNAMLCCDPMLAVAVMLRQRPPRRRPQQRELTLPPGCVLAVRYSSR